MHILSDFSHGSFLIALRVFCLEFTTNPIDPYSIFFYPFSYFVYLMFAHNHYLVIQPIFAASLGLFISLLSDTSM